MAKKHDLQKKLLSLLQRKRLTTTDELLDEALELFPSDVRSDRKTRYRLQRTLKRLEDNNLVDVYPTERSLFARLTGQGKKKLRTLKLDHDRSLTPMRWDGFWRIVIMSIPEDRKDERDAFRYLLKKANFVCIKNAVWVSPYPLEHLLENLKDDFGFTDEVLVILSNKVDHATEHIFFEAVRDL